MDRRTGYFDQAAETAPWEQRQAGQIEALKGLLPMAASRARAVGERFERAGIDPGGVRSLGDLAAIPLTRKGDLTLVQQADPPFGGFLTGNISDLKRIYVSPGPIYDPKGRGENDQRCQTALYAAGVRPGDVVQNCFLYHFTPFGLHFDDALADMGCVTVPAGVGNTQLQAQVMYDLGVGAFVGTPSFLKTILDAAIEQGRDPRRDLAIHSAVVGAEMLPPSLRAEIQDMADMVVTQAFGTADVGLIGHECSEQNGFHFHDEVIVEVIDPDTGAGVDFGTPGEMVVTSLNPTYPVIRLGTGDLVVVEHGDCPCHRTSPRLTQILGRVDMVTKVRGQFVHPSHVMKLCGMFGRIERGRVVVDREGHRDTMVFEAVLADPSAASEDFKDRLTASAREVFRLRAEVSFVDGSAFNADSPPIVDRRKWD